MDIAGDDHMSVIAEGTGQQPQGSQLADWAQRFGLHDVHERRVAMADGVRLRIAHFRTTKRTAKGVALYLNGRTEFIEKTMDTYADLAASGFDVWTLDWRGQGLSDRALADRHKGHIETYQHYLDDLHQVITATTDITTHAGTKLLLAHSMGGHIGLRYLHDHQDVFDHAAFSAPMIDIPVNIPPLRLFNRLRLRFAHGERYATGTGRYQPRFENKDDPTDYGRLEDYIALRSKFKAFTSDAARLRAMEAAVRHTPHLAIGGPTFAWMEATFSSIRTLLSPGYPEAIQTPSLIVGGGQDTIVLTDRERELAARMPHARFELIDEAGHEIFIERDEIRQRFFDHLADLIGVPIKANAYDPLADGGSNDERSNDGGS